MSESAEQIALFQWAGLATAAVPELRLLHAIPNGGLRTKTTAARLKREGLKPGVPDIVLPVARHGWHGLYIELKFGKGRVSESQQWWHDELTSQRYAVFVCWGWLAAKKTILAYLSDGIIYEQNAAATH
jgi:hypothetical protein